MEDLIRRSDAIKAVEECLKLLARPRYTVKTAIEAIPSVEIPHSDDWEKYSDKLWKNAYERGKADRPQDWIPCSERLPKSHGYYICTCKDGSKYKRTTVVKWSNGWQLTGSRSYWVVVAWMPLPEPWKGADDD